MGDPIRHEPPELFAVIGTDPGVAVAQAALDEWEVEEERRLRALGKALRRAEKWAREHLATCGDQPWECRYCGRDGRTQSTPEDTPS